MEECASVSASGPAASRRVFLHPHPVAARILAEAPALPPRGGSPPGLARAARRGGWGRPEGRPAPSGHGGAVPGLGPAAEPGRRPGLEAPPPPRPGAEAWAPAPESPPAAPAGRVVSPHHALAVFRVHQEEGLSVPPAEVPGPLPAGEAEPGAAQPGPVPGHRVPRPSPLGQMVSQ